MRLVCPNCAAQYEVDASAIPDDGRDVQCANCGNTWFQKPETAEDAASEQLEQDSAAAIRPEAPQVDQAVLDILRKEAELDASSRQVESEPESDIPEDDDAVDPEPEQDDQVSEAPENQSLAQRAMAARSNLKSNKTRERRIHLSSSDEGAPDATERRYPDKFDDNHNATDQQTAAQPAPQREYAVQRPPSNIPDVDELNSTLRSADDSSRAKEKRSRKSAGKTGGRAGSFGFYLAILIFLILLAAYVLKAQIVSALPDAAPYLDQYTDMVDLVRHRLADGMLALIDAVSKLLAQYL